MLMKKSLKTFALLGSGMIILSCTLVVINQTAGVVQLAKEVHPTFGTITLWGLLTVYAGVIGVPLVMIMRMPKPLVPPSAESGPEFEHHLTQLRERLASNPRLHLETVGPVDREKVEDAIRALDAEADLLVKQMATTVFLTTAVSQSGRLDALLVLSAQSRMVWKVAQLYYQRPSLRDLTHLYANVAATSLLAGELDDLELHQMIQPVVTASLGTMGGAIPGFQVFTTIAVNSLLSGSANAFLTLRVGMIAKAYCGSLVAQPRTKLRRSATAESARMLSGIVKESGARVRDALWQEVKQKLPRPWPMRKAHAETV
jgi:hypothetical protein